jgi:hypothetical protein
LFKATFEKTAIKNAAAILKLPSELACSIFSQLSQPELLVISQVCRQWRSYVQDTPAFWRTTRFNFALTPQALLDAQTVTTSDQGHELMNTFMTAPSLETVCNNYGWHIEKLTMEYVDRDASKALSFCPNVIDLTLRHSLDTAALLSVNSFDLYGHQLSRLCIIYEHKAGELVITDDVQAACPWTDELLGGIFRLCPNLTSVWLDKCNQISGDCFERLGGPKLQSLDLIQMNSLYIPSLLELLQRMRNVTRLSLDVAFPCLANVVHTVALCCKKVQYLYISNVEQDRVSFSFRLVLLLSNCLNLRCLYINNFEGFTDVELGILARSKVCQQIEEFGYAGGSITDSGILELSERCHNLRVLELLCCTSLTSVGLLGLLQNNQQLKHCEMMVDSFGILRHMPDWNKQLRVVKLSYMGEVDNMYVWNALYAYAAQCKSLDLVWVSTITELYVWRYGKEEDFPLLSKYVRHA